MAVAIRGDVPTMIYLVESLHVRPLLLITSAESVDDTRGLFGKLIVALLRIFSLISRCHLRRMDLVRRPPSAGVREVGNGIAHFPFKFF